MPAVQLEHTEVKDGAGEEKQEAVETVAGDEQQSAPSAFLWKTSDDCR
jgi:hypothetical protein